MSRILLVISKLQGGGAERVAATLAEAWSAQGHAVTVLTTLAGRPGAAEYPLPPAVRRVRLDIDLAGGTRLQRALALARLVARLRRAVRDAAAERVIGFVDVTNVLLLLACAGSGIRPVVCERTDPAHWTGVSRPFRALRRRLYRHAALVVAQTQPAADWLAAECRCPVTVLRNPLRELPTASDPGARAPLVVAVGRLDRLKGVDTVLHAFARTRARHPAWRLVVLGDGPMRAELQSLAASLGLADAVQFAGHVAGVEGWYARASILAHGSRLEGYPNVLLEAMACGVCVVSTDCPSGPAELIRDGVNGFLVPVDDVPAMAQRLDALMGEPALRARLAREALGVRDSHDTGRVAAQWLGALH